MKYLQVLLLTDVTFLCYLFRSYKSSDSIWHRCCIIHSIKICIWLFVVKQRSTNGQTQLPLSVSSAAAVRRNRSSVFSPSDYRAPGRFKLTVMDNMISACKRKGRWRHKHIINIQAIIVKHLLDDCSLDVSWLICSEKDFAPVNQLRPTVFLFIYRPQLLNLIIGLINA